MARTTEPLPIPESTDLEITRQTETVGDSLQTSAPTTITEPPPSFGTILAKLPGYEPRPNQEWMAQRITDAMGMGQTCVIEAGTGSGKSLAYLIPLVLGSHRPVVISTGTIALQEQLLHKDIPFALEAAQCGHLKVKLVKGRRNYLCIQKLEDVERTLSPSAPERLYTRYLKAELAQGWNGDKATLDMEIPKELWQEFESDSEDCLNSRCQYFQENPYRQAREGLEKADILVVNHALFLQDLLTGQGLLPAHSIVILDEAHQFHSYALKAFTERIGRFATQKLIRKIHKRLMPIPDLMQQALMDTDASLLSWLMRWNRPTFKLEPDLDFMQGVDQQVTLLQDLRQWLGVMDVTQLPLIETEQEADKATAQRQKLVDQLDNLIVRWDYFFAEHHPDRVNWVELQSDKLYFELKSTPLDLAERLQEHLWQDKTAILTSATLATNGALSHFRQQLGLLPSPPQWDLVLDSPFDYPSQCQLYLPESMPDPNDPMYWPAVVESVVSLLHRSQGRAFVLFTSNEAMKKVCSAVIPRITYPTKMQGDLPKHRLIDWFKQTPNSVLFATATFWEGVDIPGEALSAVIIDRIPFQAPDDPVHQAVIDRMKRQGQDWFGGYVLPEAAIRLKQGFGRLIRSRSDCGFVAILDPRMTTKGYGKKLLRSLPKVPIVRSLEQLRPLQ